MVFAMVSPYVLSVDTSENLSRTVADHACRISTAAQGPFRDAAVLAAPHGDDGACRHSGRVLPYLALTTVIITLAAGFFVEILSPKSFDSLGDAMWWAAQTVTTVGYGDVVRETGWGRVAAVFVMVFGVAAVSLTTAIVTSGFVARAQRQHRESELAEHPPVHESLARIEERLERIEQRLPR